MNLLYIGAGAYLHGVPARHLPADEIAAARYNPAALIASGLYAAAPDGAPFPPDADAPAADPAAAAASAPAPDAHQTGPLSPAQIPQE